MYRFISGPNTRPGVRWASMRRKRKFVHTRDTSRISSLHGGLEFNASQNPDKIALIEAQDGSTTTFGELDRLGARIARGLLANGVVPSTSPVAICSDTLILGHHTIGSILGALKTGNGYMPVSTVEAPERLKTILEDSKTPVLVLAGKPSETVLAIGAQVGTKILNVEELLVRSVDTDLAAWSTISEGTPAYVLYTSGSTGKPKGVVASHGSIANRLQWMLKTYPWSEGDKAMFKTQLGFVDHVWEVFGALSAGVPLVISTKEARRDPEQLVSQMRDFDVTRLVLVPSLLRAIIEIVGGRPGTLRRSIPKMRMWTVSGEALPKSLASEFLAASSCQKGESRPILLNTYGSTEVAGDVSSYEIISDKDLDGIPESSELVPIGKPIDNTTIHIVDQDTNQSVPHGDIGELLVTGRNLADGYLRDPHRTSQAFITVPPESTKAFKTGDFGYLTDDGNIVFIGRKDMSVKVNGRRVDMLEIEALCRNIRDLKEVAVVFSGPGGPNSPGAGITIFAIGEGLTDYKIYDFLKTRVPSYMLPKHVFICKGALPRLPNGKTDYVRVGLPFKDEHSPAYPYFAQVNRRSVLSTNGTGALLREEWIRALGVPEDLITSESNFYELGGDSLSIVSLTASMRRALNRHFRVSELASAATFAEMQRKIEASPTAAVGIQSDKKDLWVHLPSLSSMRSEIEDRFGLSNIQLGILFHTQVQATGSISAAYLQQTVMPVSGRLDRPKLVEAYRQLLQIHPVLRCGFQMVSDSEPYQFVVKSQNLSNFGVEFVDLKSAPDHKALSQFLELDRKRSVDISKPPLLRFSVLTSGGESHYLVMTVHHLISDGWSQDVILRQLQQLYSREASAHDLMMKGISASFREFVEWERRSSHDESSQEYWKAVLGAGAHQLPIPSSVPSKAIESQSRRYTVDLDRRLSLKLQSFSRHYNITRGAIIHAAWSLLMYRRVKPSLESGAIIYGCVSSGRSTPAVDCADLVGPVVRTFPLRLPSKTFSGSFSSVTQQVARHLFASMHHEAYPLTSMQALARCKKNQDGPATGLFNVLVNVEPPLGNIKLDSNLKLGRSEGYDSVGYPVTFRAELPNEEVENIRLIVTAESDSCTSKWCKELLGEVSEILTAGLENPEITLGSYDVEQERLSERNDLSPIQNWFFSRGFYSQNHWNQAIGLSMQDLNLPRFRSAVDCLISTHPMLRARFEHDHNTGGWTQFISPVEKSVVPRVSLAFREGNDKDMLLNLQSSLDITNGPIIQFLVQIDTKDSVREDGTIEGKAKVFIAAHHLVIDAVSQGIIIDDLAYAYKNQALPPPAVSYAEWTRAVLEHNASIPPSLIKSAEIKLEDKTKDLEKDAGYIDMKFTADDTTKLVRAGEVAGMEGGNGLHEILVAGLLVAFHQCKGCTNLTIHLESHGRNIVPDMDLSRTVGWFTSIFAQQFSLDISQDGSTRSEVVCARALHAVQKKLQSQLQHSSRLENTNSNPTPLAENADSALVFNYLGKIVSEIGGDVGWEIIWDQILDKTSRGATNQRPFSLSIDAALVGDELRTEWQYGHSRYLQNQDVRLIATHWASAVRQISDHLLLESRFWKERVDRGLDLSCDFATVLEDPSRRRYTSASSVDMGRFQNLTSTMQCSKDAAIFSALLETAFMYTNASTISVYSKAHRSFLQASRQNVSLSERVNLSSQELKDKTSKGFVDAFNYVSKEDLAKFEETGMSISGLSSDYTSDDERAITAAIDISIRSGLDGDLKVKISARPTIPETVADGLLQKFVHLLNTDAQAWAYTAHQVSPQALPVSPYRSSCTIVPQLLHEGFLQAEELAPNSTAVSSGDGKHRLKLTYSSLKQMAERVSAVLLESIPQPLSSKTVPVVAICMEKGWRQVVAVLSCLMAGCCYLPMDPKLPSARIEDILNASGASAVVYTNHSSVHSDGSRALIDIDQNLYRPLETVSPQNRQRHKSSWEDLAYLIYTSGSTGAPKGVQCHHRGAVNTILDLNSNFGVNACDKVLGLSSLSFDLSVYDIFGILQAGGCLVLPDHDIPDPEHWLKLLEDEKVTIWNTVPRLMEVLVSHIEESGRKFPPSLRLVYMSGDFIPLSLASRIRALDTNPQGIQIVSMGGATEAAIWSNIFVIPSGERADLGDSWSSIPYGRPMRNQTMYIMDDNLNHCEPWVTGKVYIGGLGVAQGYHGDPEKTAEHFLVHPNTKEKLFRPGDLGRLRPEGLLEILGREDSQVKVNGFRIELAEIDKCMESHPEVVGCCTVVSRVDREEGKSQEKTSYLVSYVTLGDTKSTPELERLYKNIVTHVQAKLPAYMVPQAIEMIEKLPLSPNGKLDRKKLESLPYNLLQFSGVEAAGLPLSPGEKQLAELWAIVLGLDRKLIGPESNFFSLGGDSISCLRLVSSAGNVGIKFTVNQVFQNPSLRGLWENIDGTPDMISEVKEIRRKTSQDDDGTFPLVGVQQAYWIGMQMPKENGGVNPLLYIEYEVVDLDTSRLQRSINMLVDRHPALRSRLTSNGRIEILDTVPHVKIESRRLNLSHPLEPQLQGIRDEIIDNGFNVQHGPMFLCQVTHLGTRTWRAHFAISLMLVDARAEMILRRDLIDLYKHQDKSPAAIPTRATALKEALTVLKSTMESSRYETSRKYWERRVPSLPPPPDIPLVPPSKNSEGENNRNSPISFSHITEVLPADQWQRFKQATKRAGLTPTNALLAAFSLVLGKYSGNSNHFLLNVLHTMREGPGALDLAGNFSSTTLLEVKVDAKDTFTHTAQRLGQQLIQDIDNWHFSGTEVAKAINRHRGDAFQAAAPFVFTSTLGLAEEKEVKYNLTNARQVHTCVTPPHVLLDHQIVEEDGNLILYFDYLESRFPPGLIQSMVAKYTQVVQDLANHAEAWQSSSLQIPPSSHAVDPYRPPSPIDNCHLHALFLERSHDAANLLAISAVDNGRRHSINYSTLDKMSDAVAGKLLSLFRPASRKEPPVVAVLMLKGWRQVAAVLGCLKAGCAYLPLDPKLPKVRRCKILEASNTEVVLLESVVVSQDKGEDNSETWEVLDIDEFVDVHGPLDELSVPRDMVSSCGHSDLAYLIYTSGSTGAPKGVRCHHHGAVNTILDLNSQFSVGSHDRVLGLSSLSFDLSVYDIFGILQAGGGIILPDQDVPDPEHWLRLLERERVTIWNTVPRLMELLISHVESTRRMLPSSLRLVFMSGDFIPLSLPSRIRNLSSNEDLRIVSMGGATEAAIWSNIYEIPRGEQPKDWLSIPYGRPMRNQTMYILDENLRHCEPWVTGRVYIGGAGIAQGYHGDPKTTEDHFVTHPSTGERLFRPGDLGRVRPEGLLEILGREDSQVKVNGFRIELAEIDTAVETHPQVDGAVATVLDGKAIGVAVTCLKKNLSEEEKSNLFTSITDVVQKVLPSYMIPRSYIVVDRFPLNTNGKIDRSLLPFPKTTWRLKPSNAGGVNQTTTERAIAKAFQKVLTNDTDIESLDSKDSFFAIGGDSLSAVQLISHLQDEQLINRAGCANLSVLDLFQNPSISELAEVIDAAGSSQEFEALQHQLVQLQPGDLDLHDPLFLVHAAGASALSYLPLVSALGSDLPIYALDDNSLNSSSLFTCTSIEEVASVYCDQVTRRLSSMGSRSVEQRLVLGGWSYGGVVAVEAARQFQSAGIDVSEVVMVDSPLKVFGDAVTENRLGSIESIAEDLQSRIPSLQDSPEVALAAADHFRKCTELLHDYHVPEELKLDARILSVRPFEGSAALSSEDVLRNICREFETRELPGNHWTIVGSENAPLLADTIKNFLGHERLQSTGIQTRKVERRCKSSHVL